MQRSRPVPVMGRYVRIVPHKEPHCHCLSEALPSVRRLYCISIWPQPSENESRQASMKDSNMSSPSASSLLSLEPDSPLTACTSTRRSFSWHSRRRKLEPEDFIVSISDQLSELSAPNIYLRYFTAIISGARYPPFTQLPHRHKKGPVVVDPSGYKKAGRWQSAR